MVTRSYLQLALPHNADAFPACKAGWPRGDPRAESAAKRRCLFPISEDDPVSDGFWELIIEMQQASEQLDIPFVIVVFPTAFQLNRSAHPDVPQRILTERATKVGIDLVDLLPVYKQVCNDADPNACEGYENLLFPDVWMHPNSLGHHLAAQLITTRLESILESPLK